MKKLRFCGLFCYAALAGCAAPVYMMQTPFNESDFRQYAGPGPATLTGEAFLKTVGGDVKTCAGEDVLLVPANAYGREMELADRKRTQVANVDPRTGHYMWKTLCNAEGQFSFPGVQAGTWYVEVEINWGVADGDAIDTQGGVLEKEFELKPGQNSIILTVRDEI